MRPLIKIIFIALVFVSSIYAKDIGTITGLNGKAFVIRDAKEIALSLGDKLQEKDTIKTLAKTKVQIIFEDETIVSIGKNSRFSISEYLFEDDKAPVAKFAMLKGAMRTITGKIGKIAPDKFSVITKTATIGIRGTNFSVLVSEDGSQQIFCTFGTISVTVNGKEYIVQQGFMLEISANGEVYLKEFSPQDLKDMKEKNFAKSEAKKGSASKDTIVSNDGLMDNTREEEGNMVIKDISDSVVDAEQTGIANLVDLIAGYSMSGAVYDGTYTASQADTSIGGSGSAKLTIDFGADTASLDLNNGDVIYNQGSSVSGVSISANVATLTGVIGSTGTGSMSGTLAGATGNTATGNFDFTYNGFPSSGTFDSGTYEVSTSQPLH